MYKMSYFKEHDHDVVLQFMKDNPFVVLTGNNGDDTVATQIPVLIDQRNDKIVLRGHIMRKTDHQLAFEKNPKALVLFTGPHCYVSASWYSERNIGSTWNYMTVHARGTMRFMDDAFTIGLLTELTHKYEDQQNRPELLEHMSMEHYVQPMVNAIVGFELEIESIYPLFKLSQNRDAESYSNIITQLKATGDYNSSRIAEEMERRTGINEIKG